MTKITSRLLDSTGSSASPTPEINESGHTESIVNNIAFKMLQEPYSVTILITDDPTSGSSPIIKGEKLTLRQRCCRLDKSTCALGLLIASTVLFLILKKVL